MFCRVLLLACSVASAAVADDFFTEKVEPLLREHCFECHSHGEVMEAGLTLDSKSGWQQGGDSGPAIVPGQPDKSLLIQMVRWQDDDHQMPPDEALPAADVAVLEQWVKGGANDPRVQEVKAENPLDWWSLRPLIAVEVDPERHPIDFLIEKQLNEHQLQPAPPADRRTLIRRMHVDLHGMLPTPDQVQLFLDDDDPEAVNTLIEQLLASPRYGERWGRHWLDTIHFADSHGCEHDVKRPNAWRYRDYVVQRLNEDVAWSDFIKEQLAADHFFPERSDLMAGLGFIAAGPLELSRAGTAPVTFDYLDRDDIVTQVMAALVSTTANCARCHTHKFDPITQDDYYALQAVFAGVGKGDIQYDEDPRVHQRRQSLQQILAACEASDPAVLLRSDLQPIVASWEQKHQQQSVNWTPLQPEVFLSDIGATLTKQDDGSIFVDGALADQEVTSVTAPVHLKSVTAVQLEVLKDERLPMGGPGRAGNGNLHLSEVAMNWFPTGAKTGQKLTLRHASADFDQAGWTSAQAIDGDPKTGWAIFPSVNTSHRIVFELSKPIEVGAGGKLAISLKQLYPPKHFIGRFRLSVTSDPVEAARVLPPQVAQALAVPSDQQDSAQRQAIAAIALRGHADQQLASLPAKVSVYGVSSSWSHAKLLPQPMTPKTVHVLRRGEFDQPLREAVPGALQVLEALPGRFSLSDVNDESARRAALATWIADENNPLTWRSIVNRVWHHHFGRGLCETPNDFGKMGSTPSHPELLDWLAVWFRDEAKGSLKALHRLILTSETWQRSSVLAASEDFARAQELDAENRLLWRMNRRRLDAESFRDSILQIAGKLDLTIGGPGIEQFVKKKGPQATPALDYAAYDWNASASHRRSVYRVVWRGIPDPFMDAMDFPDMALLAPKRGFSVSPLQSLALFNNDFVLHASQWMEGRLQQSPASERVRLAVQWCWQRSPSSTEQERLQSYADQHGLAALCRVLLNSNEFLFVD